ncbi:MAG: ferritin [Opitutales bacterium]
MPKTSTRVQDALNEQINHEFTSYYAYLAIHAYLETTPYAGFSSWMLAQAEEEKLHAMKIFNYLNDRGGKVTLRVIEQPKTDFSTPLEIFKTSLAQEAKVTQQINELYEIAREEKDFATQEFLGWFLTEQVEEEKSAQDWVDRLELAGDRVEALFLLDAEAAKRPTEAETEA